MKNLTGHDMLLRRCRSVALAHDGCDTIHQELDIHPDFREAVQRAGLDSFDALMLTAGEASLEKPKLGGWRERLVLQLGGCRLFLKRYQSPPWRQQLTTRLRGFGTTAEVEKHWLDRIRRAGIDVPDPVIYGARHRRGIEIASLLATKQVPGQSLERWVRGSGARKLDDRSFKLELIEATAALVRRLHESGFVHRDLYLSHIFFEQSREGCVQLALIDLQRVLTPNLRRQRWFVKDLAALDYSTPPAAASRSDRLRWFLRYRETGRLAEADRAFVRAVVRKSRRIARRDMRERLKATCDPQAQPGPEGTMPLHFFRADDRTRVWAADTARGRMVYKRFEAPTWRQVALLLCGQHPAQLERKMNRRLRDAGIRTVPIVYHGLERSGLRIRAWQATPFMGLSLHRRFRGRTESGDALERSVDAAARLTANLIRAGFSFKDLKPSNIIIDDGGEAWLIDVGSVRRSTREAQVKRMLGVMERTLQRTGASDSLRARFAERVTQSSPPGRGRRAQRAR